MSLQKILDKLLKKEGDEAMPQSYHIAGFDLECLKSIEHSPRKKVYNILWMSGRNGEIFILWMRKSP